MKEKKLFSWYFTLSCLAYGPLVSDRIIDILTKNDINFWIILSVFALTSLCLFVFSINLQSILNSYPIGVSSFKLAKNNLNKYFASIAASGAIVDYFLTCTIMALYTANICSIIFNFINYKFIIFVSIGILFISAITTYFKIKINKNILKILSGFFLLFFLIFLGIVLYFHQADNDFRLHINFFTQVKSSGLFAFIIVKMFAFLMISSIGFDSIRFSEAKEKQTGVYRVAIIVNLILLFILFISCNFGINDTSIFQFFNRITNMRIFSVIFSSFIALIMFIATCNSFAILPMLAQELAREKFFPSVFRNTKDDFLYFNNILLIFIISVIIILLSKGIIDYFIELYAVSAMVTIGISHYAISKKLNGFRKNIAILGTVISLFLILFFSFLYILKGFYFLWLGIILLALFMLFTRNYYIKLEKDLKLRRNRLPFNARNSSIVIITDMDRGVMPAVRYAVSIAVDCRAIYIAHDEENERNIINDWEYFFPDIPLIVMRNKKSYNVIRPILKYINYSIASKSVGLITVVIPEFIPTSPIYMIFHRNYGFLLKILLGFKKDIIVTSVPYWSMKK